MDKRKTYTSEGIDVEYGPRRCIHFAECVRSLPQVFDTGRRPWIKPDESDPDAIAAVVERCPTGALHHVRKDGGAVEPLPAAKTLTASPNGPLFVHADVTLVTPEGIEFQDTRLALCRCGHSQNKPFCDNSHGAAGFQDSGQLHGYEPGVQSGPADGPLRVSIQANGPYLLKGNFAVTSADQKTVVVRRRGAFCRCGHSQSKPFCDGSHAKIGFKGAEGEVL